MPWEPENLVEIGRFSTSAEAHEFGLVVLSQGENYWLDREGEDWVLLVVPEKADFLAHQLDLYEEEILHWPPPEPSAHEYPTGLSPVFVWAFLLILSYGASLYWPVLQEWGRVDADAVRGGEFYRVLTALFLHADFGHLLSNLLIGGFFLFFCARQMGAVLAVIATFAAGAGGNFLNVLLYQPEPHFSIGASTAVFGTVGLLVAYPLGNGQFQGNRRILQRSLIPILAGMALLAFLGTGDEFTDTTAHLTGFVSGIFLGLFLGMAKRFVPGDAQESPPSC